MRISCSITQNYNVNRMWETYIVYREFITNLSSDSIVVYCACNSRDVKILDLIRLLSGCISVDVNVYNVVKLQNNIYIVVF